MRARVKVDKIYHDYNTRHDFVTLEITEGDANNIEDMRGKDLALQLDVYSPPRSTDQNAMLWHCIGLIVEAFRRDDPVWDGDKWDIYYELLRKYGKYTSISVREDALEDFKKNWRDCEEVGRTFDGNLTWVDLICYFGSSTYNSKEFSILLDGCLDDMRQAGIPTPLSSEIKRVIEQMERREQNERRSSKHDENH